MVNLLNYHLANKPVNNPAMQAKPAYTIDTTGKVKPLEDKAQLLPSRIFGSPIEYAKDIKKDFSNIGKAAKGKANDHELGRINDLAMKLGASALAGYLLIKNPLKLGKTMEVIGATTFFASMALWPKLAIQAPLKARTGVDIHQKYIDSQGRKKMLHQDPQYDLTDLYSRQDLDKMGKKLKVDENLPDRDRFIKQRAKKTAIQGNTLWMMTAGFATPLASALMCNALEEPVSKVIEKSNLLFTDKLLNNEELFKKAVNRSVKADSDFISKFCKKHADDVVTDELLNVVSKRMTKGMPKTVEKAFKDEISNFAKSQLKVEHVENILKDCGLADSIVSGLSSSEKKYFVSLINKGTDLDVLFDFVESKKGDISKLDDAIAKGKMSSVKVGDLKDTLEKISSVLSPTKAKQNILNKYIKARIGDDPSIYVSKQWQKTTKTFFKELGLSNKDLKSIVKGDFSMLEEKMTALAQDKTKFEAFKTRFLGYADDYNKVAGDKLVETVKKTTEELFETAREGFEKEKLSILQKPFIHNVNNVEALNMNTSAAGSVIRDVSDKTSGVKASFYRMFQAVDIRRKDLLKNSLRESGIAENKLDDLVKVCKKVSSKATVTDFIEKLKNCGFNLTEGEYKAVSKALYNNFDSVNNDKNYMKYCAEFISKVTNMGNKILGNCALGDAVKSNNKERTQVVGSWIEKTLSDTAKNMLNSKKWLKISGIGFATLTAVTLLSTLAFGRKGTVEKQVEEQKQGNNKANG